MIIDYDESKRTGQVMTLAAMGRFSEAVDVIAAPANDETMPLRVADVQRAIKPVAPTRGSVENFRPDIAKSEVLEYRPKWEPGPFPGTFRRDSSGRFEGDKPAGVERPITLSLVHPDRPIYTGPPREDTGTHALPAVEKMTGKPSLSAIAHRTARQIQGLYPHVMIWYGEYTNEFWVMDGTGLRPFKTITQMCQSMGW